MFHSIIHHFIHQVLVNSSINFRKLSRRMVKVPSKINLNRSGHVDSRTYGVKESSGHILTLRLFSRHQGADCVMLEAENPET